MADSVIMKIQKPINPNNKLYQLESSDVGEYQNVNTNEKFNVFESSEVYMPDNAPDWVELDSIESAMSHFNIVMIKNQKDLTNGDY